MQGKGGEKALQLCKVQALASAMTRNAVQLG
jgi:hypothetical protein